MASERNLTSKEISELNAMLSKEYKLIDLDENAIPNNNVDVVAQIDKTLSALRLQRLPDDKANSIAFTLGFLLGEKWREAFGWDWRFITQDNGFSSYGVVRPDKSYVYFAMKDIYQLLIDRRDELNILLLFNMVKANSLPETKKKYVSLG